MRKEEKMKIFAFILSIISLFLWWEAPYCAACLIALNAAVLFFRYDKSVICRLTAIFSIIALGLSIWNRDLHVGLEMLKMYYGA